MNRFMINRAKLFCSDIMKKNYYQQFKTVNEKKNSLKVEKIYNGIVHPLQSTDQKLNTKKPVVYGGVTDDKLKLIKLSIHKVTSPNFEKK